MRYALLLAPLLFLLATADPIFAQCATNAVQVTVHRNSAGAATGQVTLASADPAKLIRRVEVNPSNGGGATYLGPGWNSPRALPVVEQPNAATFSFSVYAATPGTAVTVPIVVTLDGGCVWPTFVGGGPDVIPLTGPTSTATPLPTATRVPQPTAITPVVIATATQQTVPTVYSFPDETRPSNDVVLTWSGRMNPTTSDYVALANLAGNLVGPPIFTSSCNTTPGTVARKEGQCEITLSNTIPAGQYLIRFYASNNSNNAIATGTKYLKVQPTGAALMGAGQLWGTVASFHIPEISLIGGFVGFQGGLNAGDPGDISPGDKYHHLGLSDFALLGDNFIEAGVWRQCTSGIPNFCAGWPYMSWSDTFGQIQEVAWNGFGGFPPIPLPANLGTIYQFQVYETVDTVWTANFCDQGYCCPIWHSGIPCTGRKANDLLPRTLLTRMKQIFAGSETPSKGAQSGVTDVSNPAYCCHFGITNWTPLDCWEQPLDGYDHRVIRADLSPCIPYSGWFAITWLQ
jgi:hypothetical protein